MQGKDCECVDVYSYSINMQYLLTHEQYHIYGYQAGGNQNKNVY
jgi:hypothetical protein